MKLLTLLLSIFMGLTCRAQWFVPENTYSHEFPLTVLSLSITQNLVIAGDEKGYLHLHNPKNGYLIKSIKVHESAVTGIRFNSTGKLMISYTSDGEIKIYDFDKEKIIQSIFSPDYQGIKFVLFSIADGFLYFNCKEKLYKTRSDLTQPLNLIRTESNNISDGVLTTDRSALIYAFGNKLKVINTRTDMDRQEISAGTSPVIHLALVGDTLLTSWSADGTISFWHYILGQLDVHPVLSFKAGNPSPMSFSSNGEWMASGRIGNWARIWKPMDRNIIQELFSHTNTVTHAVFGNDANSLFTCGEDGLFIRWIKSDVKKEVKQLSTAAPMSPPAPLSINVDSVINIPSLAEVTMAENNVPSNLQGRLVINTNSIEVKTSNLKIYVYDNSYIDGDTMSLFFNGNWVINNYGVTKKKKEVILDLLPNTNNYLVLFANNLGKNPPNTAVVEINSGTEKKIFRISSDMRSCSAINFVYKP